LSENRTVKGVELNYSLCSNYKLLSINVTDPIDSSHAGSVSFITHQIRQKKRENKRFRRTVEGLIKSLINQAT
jgi:hypothetical protein